MRHHANWLESFLEYASFGEAPLHMYFWTGVSTIAGALQRKCWIDQGHFKWYPNFYIIIVAPPGIVSKSTTAGIGMSLLRAVPGVNFGPEIVTWQSLAKSFGDAAQVFEVGGKALRMSTLSIESSEFGNLLDPTDKAMVDLLVTLWDGKDIKKETKNHGSDNITNPLINIIGCTTPAWIAGNFPEYMVQGGLTSRMLFVYAEKKRQYIAYPKDHAPKNIETLRASLTADLCDIQKNCVGEYLLTKEAKVWGEDWYKKHLTIRNDKLDETLFGGYIARKQTQVHKLAIVLTAAVGNSDIITLDTLKLAYTMVTDLEPDMNQVFSRIGKTDRSLYADKLVSYVRRCGPLPYSDVYRFMYSQFPSLRDFEDVFRGSIEAGFLRLQTVNGIPTVSSIERP